MITHKAIFTVLYALGLPPKACNAVLYRWLYYDFNIEKFEEIRHHEIQFFYPKVYRQRKYLE